jgi:uncharacterized membrane protein
MSDIGFYHPLIVHFVIALAIVGVLFRWASFTGAAAFTGPAATVLLLLGTAAAVVAVQSGSDASIDVEAIPGAAALVGEHREWGLWSRNTLLAISALELFAVIFKRRGWASPALLGSTALGVAALVCVVETGKRGGEIVYAHAGGVGIRSGDPADVEHLLLAGLYEQAQLDERAGRDDDAAALIETTARRFPSEPAVQVMAAQSLLEHRHDPAAALALLRTITVATDESSLRFRREWLTADALEALGQTDMARATLLRLRTEFPQSARLQRRLGNTQANASGHNR